MGCLNPFPRLLKRQTSCLRLFCPTMTRNTECGSLFVRISRVPTVSVRTSQVLLSSGKGLGSWVISRLEPVVLLSLMFKRSWPIVLGSSQVVLVTMNQVVSQSKNLGRFYTVLVPYSHYGKCSPVKGHCITIVQRTIRRAFPCRVRFMKLVEVHGSLLHFMLLCPIVTSLSFLFRGRVVVARSGTTRQVFSVIVGILWNQIMDHIIIEEGGVVPQKKRTGS